MAEQQKVTIPIPDDLRPDEREEFAEGVIEYIKTRSREGVGVRKVGRGFSAYQFPAYSEKYAKRKGQSNVDLTLSEEMLESIELLRHKRGEITIGFQRGTEVNAKAEGNQIGSYGQPRGNRAKARRFLGLTADERAELLDMYDYE